LTKAINWLILILAMNSQLRQRAERMRRFNRFYTRQIGVLQQGLLDSPFSLGEVRVLYELAHAEGLHATELAADLKLDPGYLSRLLRGFESKGLIQRKTSAADARQQSISLTAKGRRTFAPLNERSTQEVAAMLERLPETAQTQLLASAQTIERLLGETDRAPAYVLRPHRAGDIGWVIARHGAIYAEEYGWNFNFEGLVAEIAGAFLKNYDPARERCWIAERDGANLGSVFLVKGNDETAKLRLLLVEPQARGLGIGRRLVEECVAFARQAGYRKITLWTQSMLVAARRLYLDAGFVLVDSKPHRSFGADLVGETWDLILRKS
jgi:DNA-binding MarR family transcriptional regulator/predicted GNAT family acetyltransferase